MPEKKTYDEHYIYLTEIVKLSLWIAADVKNKRPQEDFLWILDERTPLFSNTTFNKNHFFAREDFDTDEWMDMKKQLRAIYEKNSNPDTFEKMGINLLDKYIEPRVEKDFHDMNYEDPDDIEVEESWARYDTSIKEEYMELHMENSLYPNSFLSDKTHFYKMLRIVVEDAEKAGYKGIYSGSWLNNYVGWTNLMPEEWNSSKYEQKDVIEWHLGFWGQFLRSNDTFNFKSSQYYRENGKVKYPEVSCRASIDSFKKLLEENS